MNLANLAMKVRNCLLLFVVSATLLISALTASAADAAPGGGDGVHEKSLLDKFHEGGIVMWPLLGCSIAMLYLTIDGSLRTARTRAIPPDQLTAVQNYFRQGDYVAAYRYLKTVKSPFANVCRVGISMLGEGKAGVEEAVIQEISKENSQMMHYISYLSVIGVCTPMVGILGTVSGMISAFETLGSAGIGDPSKLAAAIGEVLVATFSGLFIAIPAFAAYYFLRNRVSKAIHDVQDTMNSLFRRMPYEQLAGADIGGEELYANAPNWVAANEGVAAEINA
jgi:biopolymer transport protein ExbB